MSMPKMTPDGMAYILMSLKSKISPFYGFFITFLAFEGRVPMCVIRGCLTCSHFPVYRTCRDSAEAFWLNVN